MSMTKCVNGSLRVGDIVISAPSNGYGCLIGMVIKITLAGTSEHSTEAENETDNVHVNFVAYEYPKNRIKEIEKIFTDLYGEKKAFDECSLDNTIMPPNYLIRITGIDETRLSRLLQSGYEAACYCYGILYTLLNHSVEIKPDTDDLASHIFNAIYPALDRAGFNVLEGDRDSVFIRHNSTNSDYKIHVSRLD